MITSMTGFGRGEASHDGLLVTVEIKTLNSRYLDVSARMPSQISNKELSLKEQIQEKIHRGKVNVSVNVNKSRTGEPDITYSPELVKSYSKMLDEIKNVSNISRPLELRDLLRFEDIFINKPEDESTIELIWKLVKEATSNALETVNRMREKEGGQLKEELNNQILGIEELLESITSMAVERAPDAQKRLKDRLANLLTDDKVDPERLEMEIALLADKMDINEEIVRLKSHLKFFHEALESSESVGRRLNFLCQEINRELNTIGSKANDTGISHQVVFAKEKLEQIREQVQNIE
ncbi:MAG: YicC/YloC family endoribonuclease [Balneolaceae bacterium]